jgi:hypothetical protein
VSKSFKNISVVATATMVSRFLGLGRDMLVTAVFGTAALAFSLFHADPHHVAGVLPLAFFLAWAAARAGTLVTVVAHVANNTVAILALGSETLAVGYGTEREMPWSWVPLGLAVALACAWIIARDASPLNSPAVPCSAAPHAEDRPD